MAMDHKFKTKEFPLNRIHAFRNPCPGDYYRLLRYHSLLAEVSIVPRTGVAGTRQTHYGQVGAYA